MFWSIDKYLLHFGSDMGKKLSLEIGCSQGIVYGFTRYDDNHERANKLISFLGEKLNFDFYEING